MSEEKKGNSGQYPCPNCNYPVTKVRSTANIRRSRNCVKCGTAFTTYEIPDTDYHLLQSVIDAIKGKAGNWLPGQHRKTKI